VLLSCRGRAAARAVAKTDEELRVQLRAWSQAGSSDAHWRFARESGDPGGHGAGPADELARQAVVELAKLLEDRGDGAEANGKSEAPAPRLAPATSAMALQRLLAETCRELVALADELCHAQDSSKAEAITQSEPEEDESASARGGDSHGEVLKGVVSGLWKEITGLRAVMETNTIS